MLRVVGKTKTNQGSLPSEYDDEQTVISMYNWVGTDKPDIKIIDNLNLVKDPFPKAYRTDIWEGIISFNSRELKKLNFEVIKTDDKYKKKEGHLMSVVGIGWRNIHNLDFGFIQLLEYAEKNKTLIDDTK